MQISSALDDDAMWEHRAYLAGLVDESYLRDDEPEPAELDPARLHEFALEDLVDAVTQGRRLLASQYRILSDTLRHAAETPDPWVGPDPTTDPGWVDSRDRSAGAVRRERREIAVRAAAADIAVRLRMSEVTVRTHAAHADTLRDRCPKLWHAFLHGRVQEANAVTAAKLAASLPHNTPDSWALFDEQATDAAERLTPAKFRTRARTIRERVHAESLEERHRRAATDRAVWITPELDGMAIFSALVPAADGQAAMNELDAIAKHLSGQDGEDRTLAQLRADALIDLLQRQTDTGTAIGKGPSVAITVPVMTLLGESDEPATLDGYGPIDLDTAKSLAGSATSWIRILTHPITGTVLDMDRTSYRVPAALRRWLTVHHPTCTFPGCVRPARKCDIDHLTDWQYGGATNATNLAPECEHHHILKHGSRWHVARDPDGHITWTSPTGHQTDPDPPPF